MMKKDGKGKMPQWLVVVLGVIIGIGIMFCFAKVIQSSQQKTFQSNMGTLQNR